MVFGGDFLILWMGKGFAASIPILLLLTLPSFLTLPTMVFNYYLYATNRHKLNARVLALEASSNILLSILFVRHFGLAGIALGTLIPALLCRGLILPLEATKSSPITLADYVRGSFVSCLPLAAAQFAMLFLLRSTIGAQSWIGFLSCNALGLSFFALLVWTFYLGAEEKAYLARRLR